MFEGKTVIITGGGKNIGRGIAEKFFFQEANVVVNDILPLEKTQIIDEMIFSENFLFSQGDISSLDYQEKLVKETLKKFSKIDILINNAGIGSGKGFFDMHPKIMKKSIMTNFFAPFFLSQKVAKHMVKNKIAGSFLFISSIHARIPSGNADYSSSKSALEIAVKEMALELGEYGIRVNAIAPGKITQDKIKDKRIPLENKSGVFEDIAQAALFLCNNRFSGYITGEVLVVDGGLSLTFKR